MRGRKLKNLLAEQMLDNALFWNVNSKKVVMPVCARGWCASSAIPKF